MKIYFNISEFIIDQKASQVPIHVVDKIVKHHLPIINPIREKLGVPVYVSQHSGFRTKKWELSKGRKGDSQHTFGDGQKNQQSWLGAVDYTCSDFEGLVSELMASEYTRICVYEKERFVHCDFKGTQKKFYKAENGVWEPYV